MTHDDRYGAFRALHESGCFVIPNPWDVGSARLLVQLGFKALATTSVGFAWSMGVRDRAASLESALAHFRTMSDAVSVPVSADFRDGYAVSPDEVAAHVAQAAATGVAGLSIEDSTGDPSSPLFEFEHAVDRVRAARAAVDRSERGLVFVARSEGFVAGRPDLRETIRRLTAFAEAGADCLYAPGLRSLDDIRAVVQAVSPKPVNVGVFADFTTVQALAEAGVRRISVGGALARVALSAFLEASGEIATHGTFGALRHALPGREIDDAFE